MNHIVTIVYLYFNFDCSYAVVYEIKNFKFLYVQTCIINFPLSCYEKSNLRYDIKHCYFHFI